MTALVFSPDGQTLVTGDRDGFVTHWDIASQAIQNRTGPRDGGVETLVYSPNGKWLVAGVRYDHIAVFDSEGKALFNIDKGKKELARYHTLVFYPGTNYLVAPNDAKQLDLWDLEKRYYVDGPIALERTETAWAYGYVGANQGYLVRARAYDPRLEVYDASTRVLLTTFEVGLAEPRCLSSSPNQRVMVAGYPNGKLFISRNVVPISPRQYGDEIVVKLHDTEGSIASAQWLSSDRLLTAGEDGWVHEWNVPALFPVSLRTMDRCVAAAFGSDVVAARRCQSFSDDVESWVDVCSGRDGGRKASFPGCTVDLPRFNPPQASELQSIHAKSNRIAIARANMANIYDINSGEELVRIDLSSTDRSSEANASGTSRVWIRQIVWSPLGEKLGIVSEMHDADTHSEQLSLFHCNADRSEYRRLGQ